jgi:hypothetical protein
MCTRHDDLLHDVESFDPGRQNRRRIEYLMNGIWISAATIRKVRGRWQPDDSDGWRTELSESCQHHRRADLVFRVARQGGIWEQN